MQNAPITIYCPNEVCQAANPDSHRFCQQCRTPLPKRYLWVVGKESGALRSGELLGGRYVPMHDRIVLDTQPGLLPEPVTELPESAEAYLRLLPFPLHVPQVFAVVPSSKRGQGSLLLLEQGPIAPEATNPALEIAEGTLRPELGAVWKSSSGVRQLNWLRQIAQLWQPLSTQGVVATLLNPALLRVEGSIVRLLELQQDGRSTPTLSDLGQLWRRWQTAANPEIADFLAELCQKLVRREVTSPEQLEVILDRALTVCAGQQIRQVQVATLTDQGPTRQRNEDACYPPSGTIASLTDGPARNTPRTMPLVVVCDGIGGHEGGNVASNLAIATVQQELQPLIQTSEPVLLATLVTALEQAALAANDALSQRNDHEHRQERQRMGTTLVMAFVQAHELYLAHVGDSRAYRITPLGCHQVTVDDDLASREVRLGYSLYREALQQPGSGSLVQALGMGASSFLHPTVQRFVLDEDCLFLLCSDGLSDHDRVEQNWQTELLPVLEGKLDLGTAAQRLVTIANTQNGHDNVTVGLVHCQVSPAPKGIILSAAWASPIEAGQADDNTSGATGAAIGAARATSDTLRVGGQAPPPNSSQNLIRAATQPETLKTEFVAPRKSTSAIVVLLGILTLWVFGGALAYWLLPEVRAWVHSLTSPTSTPGPTLATVPEEPPPTTKTPPVLTVGSLVQIEPAASGNPPAQALVLLPQPDRPPASGQTNSDRALPPGSVLKISARRQISNQVSWLQLMVCSVPPGTNSPTFQPGDTGWVPEPTIAASVTQNLSLTAAQLGKCTPITPPTTPPGVP